MTPSRSLAGRSLLGLLLPALVATTGCSREDLYGGQTFTQTVAQAYADCNDSEIRFLAGKQGIQTAFAECGSNKFAHKAWSPDGRHLYFQLTHGGHIMDGETKDIITVPTETPVEAAAWLNINLVAVPLGPAEDSTTGHSRVAFYNRGVNTLEVHSVPLEDIADLQAAPGDAGLLLTGDPGDGSRKAYTVDVETGELAPTLPWLPAGVTDLQVSPEAGLVGVATAAGGALYDLDGDEKGRWAEVKRVVPHPEGRYVALELDGAPVSPFDMRSWDELSEESRQRELARQEKWLEKQPDHLQKEIIPPELQVVDLDNGGRYRVTFVWGDRFEWYARNYYVSFVMFGIEGKQLNRNVVLTNLHERLRMLGKGETPTGMEVIDAPAGTDAPSGDGAGGQDEATDEAPGEAAE